MCTLFGFFYIRFLDMYTFRLFLYKYLYIFTLVDVLFLHGFLLYIHRVTAFFYIPPGIGEVKF
jgi:hypothetical protein